MINFDQFDCINTRIFIKYSELYNFLKFTDEMIVFIERKYCPQYMHAVRTDYSANFKFGYRNFQF